jgi:hypothetical protein
VETDQEKEPEGEQAEQDKPVTNINFPIENPMQILADVFKE